MDNNQMSCPLAYEKVKAHQQSKSSYIQKRVTWYLKSDLNINKQIVHKCVNTLNITGLVT